MKGSAVALLVGTTGKGPKKIERLLRVGTFGILKKKM